MKFKTSAVVSQTLPASQTERIDFVQKTLGKPKWGVQKSTIGNSGFQLVSSENPSLKITPEELRLARQRVLEQARSGNSAKPLAGSMATAVGIGFKYTQSEIESFVIQKSIELARSQSGQPAAAVLARLKALDPLEELRLAYLQTKNSPEIVSVSIHGALQTAAWRALMHLCGSPAGVDALAQFPVLANYSSENKRLLVNYMRALRHQLDPSRPCFLPADVMSVARGSSDVAAQALIAVGAHAAGDLAVYQAHQWAITAMSNGLLKTGLGSAFMEIDQRLNKTHQWLKRLGQSLRWSSWNPLRRKSPFFAMRFGFMGVDRTDIHVHKKQYRESFNFLCNALLERSQTIVEMAGKHDVPPRTLVRAQAMCAVFRELEARHADKAVPIPVCTKLSRVQVQNIVSSLRSLVPSEGQAVLRQEVIRLIKTKHIDLGFLRICEKKLRSAATSDTAFSTQFNKRLKQASDDLYGDSSQNEKIDAKRVVDKLHHAIDHIQGASRWRLFGGGSFGAGTKGITGLLSLAASFFVGRFRLDLRAGRSRFAAMELALPPYNMELLLYSQTGDQFQLGAGAAVGPEVNLASVTAGVDLVCRGLDRSRARGICLRLPRIRGQEASLRKEFKSLVTDLFSLPSQPSQPGELLKLLLGKYPDLSVSTIGEFKEKRVWHELSGELTASVGMDAAKALFSADVGLKYQSAIQRKYSDFRGNIVVKRRMGGKSLRGAAGARIAGRVLGSWGGEQLGLLSAEGLGLSKEYMSAGRQLRQDVVRIDGRLHPFTFYEVEHQTFEDFESSIRKNLDAWVRSKAKQANKTEAIVRQEIEQFLSAARENLENIHSFAQRFELKPEVAKYLDGLNSMAEILDSFSSSEARSRRVALRASIDQTLDSVIAYAPTSFRVYDRAERQRRLGLNLTARLERIDMAEGVYAHSRLM